MIFLANRRKKEYTEFNKNLKKLREQTGYSINEFAQLLDLPRNTYIAYENQNREPSFSILLKMAQTLHVTTDELLGNNQTELQQCLNFCSQHGYHVLDYKEIAKAEDFLSIPNDLRFNEKGIFLLLSSFYESWSETTNYTTEVVLQDKKTGEKEIIHPYLLDFIEIISPNTLIKIVKEIQNDKLINSTISNTLHKRIEEARIFERYAKSLKYMSEKLHIPTPNLSNISLEELFTIGNKITTLFMKKIEKNNDKTDD